MMNYVASVECAPNQLVGKVWFNSLITTLVMRPGFSYVCVMSTYHLMLGHLLAFSVWLLFHYSLSQAGCHSSTARKCHDVIFIMTLSCSELTKSQCYWLLQCCSLTHGAFSSDAISCSCSCFLLQVTHLKPVLIFCHFGRAGRLWPEN